MTTDRDRAELLAAWKLAVERVEAAHALRRTRAWRQAETVRQAATELERLADVPTQGSC